MSTKNHDRAHARQRVKHGVSKKDAIDLDLHLTNVAVKGIDYLIQWGNSYPSGFESIEKWHEHLRQIQRYIQIDPDDQYGLIETDEPLDDLDRMLGLDKHYELEEGWEVKYKAAEHLRDLGRKRLIQIWDDLWD